MAQPATLIYDANSGGTGGKVDLATVVDTSSFIPNTGSLTFILQCTRSNLTSFIAKPWVLDSDNSTWVELKDSSGAAVSIFGTVSSTGNLARPLYIGGTRPPCGCSMRLSLVITGTPGGTDAVRISYVEGQ